MTMLPYAPLRTDEFEIRDADGYSVQRHLSDDDRKVFSRRAAQSGTTTPAARYAREWLLAMGAESEAGLTHKTIWNLFKLLNTLTDDSSVYPILTPDGAGGMTIEWIAAPRHLTLELPSSGAYVFSEINDAGEVELYQEGRVGHLPLSLLRQRIAHLTEYVDRMNPNWRANF